MRVPPASNVRVSLTQPQRDLARRTAWRAPARAAPGTAAAPSVPRPGPTPQAGRTPPGGTSRWPPGAGPPPRRSEQHAGEDRAGTRPCWLPAPPGSPPGGTSPPGVSRPAPAGSLRRGKSSTAKGRTVNDDRSEVMSTVSPPESTTTAPGASVRTASAVSFPGTTQPPSLSPLTSMVRWMVSSRSVPLISSREPSSTQADPGQDRLRAGSALRGAGRGGQGLSEHITFAAELHRIPSLSPLSSRSSIPAGEWLASASTVGCSLNLVVVVGPVDCGLTRRRTW